MELGKTQLVFKGLCGLGPYYTCVYGIPGNVKEFGIQKQNDSDSVEQKQFVSFGRENVVFKFICSTLDPFVPFHYVAYKYAPLKVP